MAEVFRLDKTIVQGTTYQMPPDRAYIIEKIGTDATSTTKLVVDGVPTTPIINAIAPLTRTSSNLLGPLDLGNHYIVIPPDRKFWVDGPTGAKVRIIGKVVVLGVGEPLSPTYVGRYGRQGDEYITYVTGSYDHGTDTTWVDGDENDLYSLTPNTIESYVFNNYLGVSVDGGSISAGQFGLRVYMDDRLIGMLTTDAGMRGIDVYYIQHPPSDSVNEDYLSFKDKPIEVKGDHTLKFTLINDSGSDLTPASGSSYAFTLYAIVIYKRG